MPDRTQTAGLAVDLHIVGWIGDNKVRRSASHQPRDRLVRLRISAEQPMLAKQPQVAQLRDCGNLDIGNGVEAGRICPSPLLDGEINLRKRKAGQRYIETDVDERLQLDGKRLGVPPSVLGELVVGEHIGTPLVGTQVRQFQRRDFQKAQALGGQDTAVAGDDLAVVTDEDRIGETEPLDAVGDLLDLPPGVRSRVAGVRFEKPHRHHFDARRRQYLAHEKIL